LRFLALILAFQISIPSSHSQTVATTVPLIRPSAITYDSQGNLYFAETANHTIRKVDSAGYITTIAGTGTEGFSGDGGLATQAQLDSPQGLALGTTNHLYIGDTHNNRIRCLDLVTGIITTIAGSDAGFSGDGGAALAARLNRPTAIAADSDNTLYIADSSNHRIRRVTSDGVITTIAGNGVEGFSGDGGPATSATLDSPGGLAVDADKNLYVADTRNNRIRKVSAKTGVISTIAGTGSLGNLGDGTLATGAAFALPHGLTIDSTGLYIVDTANHRIRRIDQATGVVTTIVGDGIQRFAGDGGPGKQASLDMPQSAAISPTNVLTFSDTNNQRIREIEADSSTRTVAGLGTSTPGSLLLAGPSVTVYGSGHVTATLTASTDARGTVTFLDTSSEASTTVGSANLQSNAASLDLSALPAGVHNFTATYAGDQIHNPAQSPVFAVSITPRRLAANVSPSTLFYGQPVRVLTGSLSGVLPRDTSNVIAAFTTTASTLSPVGSYQIKVTLSGSAMGNYTSTPVPDLTITPAPTQTSLINPPATADASQTLSVTAHVASTTSGSPTGSLVLLDNGVPQVTMPVTSTGDSTFTLTGLTPGLHVMSAVYSGDGNFLRSVSSAYSLSIISEAPPPDFSLTPIGAVSQSATPGNSVSFSFSVQAQGSTPLSSPITLAVSGLPQFATASFNPTYVPPGSTTTNFTLTIAIPKSNLQRSGLPAFPVTIGISILPLMCLRSRKARIYFVGIVGTLAAMTLNGCGDRIYSGTQASSNPKPYAITVTGTATTPSGAVLQHTASVTLILQQN
jgi:sugar lactone lactonase YvrE